MNSLLHETFRLFRAAGIQATLGLAIAYINHSKFGPSYEVKGGGHVYTTKRGFIVGLAKVSKRKLGRWIRRGKIPHPKTTRKKVVDER